MLIPFLIGLLPALCFGPAWVEAIYNSEMKWQRTQVFLDNSAIFLGQNDRDLMNEVFQSEVRLKTLHTILHRSLSCSLIPATAAACQLTAKKIQIMIQGLITKTREVAQIKWMKGKLTAAEYLSKKDIPFILTRSSLWPRRIENCPICSLGYQWSERGGNLQSELQSARYSEISVKVSAIKNQMGHWNYRLWAR